MSQAPAQLDVEAANAVLATYDPARIVEWSARQFPDDLVMSSSFGAESAALIHIVTRVAPRIRIIMIDTGYLFPETHAFMELLRARFDLNVWIFKTRNDPIRYLREAREHDPTVRRNVEGCCAANKNEPFERAMHELKPAAWFRGIRRDQSAQRQDRQIIEWSSRYNCFAISPLLNWTTRQVHEYMHTHDLPYHPLFAKGYLSIGCNPLSCTRPVKPGEDARAGRWASQTKTECGLHLDQITIA